MKKSDLIITPLILGTLIVLCVQSAVRWSLIKDFSFHFFIYTTLIVGYLSGLFLFLGSSALEKDERQFQTVKLLKIVSIVYISFLYIPLFLSWTGINVPILDLILFYMSYYVIPILVPITFLVFGFKNRNNYGNYLISAAVLEIVYFVLFELNDSIIYNLLIEAILPYWVGESVPVEAIPYIVYFSMSKVLYAILVSLFSVFFLFFSIRIRNKPFIIYIVLLFFFEYYLLYSSLVFIAMMSGETIYIILNLAMILVPAVIGPFMAVRYFEIGNMFKRGLRVFISHSVDDFSKYRIDEIVQYLETKKGIGRVYFCEVDLTGNIDKWMNKTIPRCQLLIFLTTENSLNSRDCIHELNLARTKKLHIIPILGVGLDWEELKKLDIDRDYGSKFDPMEFEIFCNEIYEHIIKYKKAIEMEVIEEKKRKKQKKIEEIR